METSVAEKRLKRLFSKNTGICESERADVYGADTCPVLEG